MTVKQHHPVTPLATSYRSTRLTTVHISRSITKTALTVAVLAVALLLILLLR